MESIDFLAYIKPELFVIIVPVYLMGVVLKGTLAIKDKFIPLILGVLSILLCLLYFFSTAELLDARIIFGLILDAVIQGIIIASCAVYGNQVFKQLTKKE